MKFIPLQLYKCEATASHRFKVGDICCLVGLQIYPQFNGTPVKITNVRDDGELGRAYYVEGEINEQLNWVYEFRLELANANAESRNS